ncbi:MAG: nucleoside deaminase [Spirochaetes bacterium]|nr:nucleoside deaminase [Spirochaetota bacterium]
MDFHRYMSIAIEEAKLSLREGNSGFGALIIKDGEIIAKTHDTDITEDDPTAHAEMKAIRIASSRLGKDLSGCVIVSTHEPCPMCSTAIFWSGIDQAAYGYSIKDSLKQGRTRIDISLEEIFQRGGKNIEIHKDILYADCSVLYNKAVRDKVKKLRNADETKLQEIGDAICEKSVKWFKEKNIKSKESKFSGIREAYNLFLEKLEITAEEAPVIKEDEYKIVFHSKNFCPTLEACKILNMDTRLVCRHLTERATSELLRQLNPKVNFKRNYDKIRPYSSYCEEMIVMEN